MQIWRKRRMQQDWTRLLWTGLERDEPAKEWERRGEERLTVGDEMKVSRV